MVAEASTKLRCHWVRKLIHALRCKVFIIHIGFEDLAIIVAHLLYTSLYLLLLYYLPFLSLIIFAYFWLTSHVRLKIKFIEVFVRIRIVLNMLSLPQTFLLDFSEDEAPVTH
jgi:hypothetical protein